MFDDKLSKAFLDVIRKLFVRSAAQAAFQEEKTKAKDPQAAACQSVGLRQESIEQPSVLFLKEKCCGESPERLLLQKALSIEEVSVPSGK